MNINSSVTTAATKTRQGLGSTGSTVRAGSRTRQFQEVQIGQHFEFRGRRFQKLALSLACSEDRYGTVFHRDTEVLPDPWPGSTEASVRTTRF